MKRKKSNSSLSKSPDRKDGGSPLKVAGGDDKANSTMKRLKTKSKKPKPQKANKDKEED